MKRRKLSVLTLLMFVYFLGFGQTYTDLKLQTSPSVQSINSSGIRPSGGTVFGSDFGTKTYGNYYILVKIDGDEQVQETNEGNNIISIPVRYIEREN